MVEPDIVDALFSESPADKRKAIPDRADEVFADSPLLEPTLADKRKAIPDRADEVFADSPLLKPTPADKRKAISDRADEVFADSPLLKPTPTDKRKSLIAGLQQDTERQQVGRELENVEPLPILPSEKAGQKVGVGEALRLRSTAESGQELGVAGSIERGVEFGLPRIRTKYQDKVLQSLARGEVSDGALSFQAFRAGMNPPLMQSPLKDWDASEGQKITDPVERKQARKEFVQTLATEVLKERLQNRAQAGSELEARGQTIPAKIIAGGVENIGNTAQFIANPLFMFAGSANERFGELSTDKLALTPDGKLVVTAKADTLIPAIGKAIIGGSIETKIEQKGGDVFNAVLGAALARVPGGKALATLITKNPIVGKAINKFGGLTKKTGIHNILGETWGEEAPQSFVDIVIGLGLRGSEKTNTDVIERSKQAWDDFDSKEIMLSMILQIGGQGGVALAQATEAHVQEKNRLDKLLPIFGVSDATLKTMSHEDKVATFDAIKENIPVELAQEMLGKLNAKAQGEEFGITGKVIDPVKLSDEKVKYISDVSRRMAQDVPIQVFDTEADMVEKYPEITRAENYKQGAISGVWHDGKVNIVLEKMQTPNDIVSTISHEVGVHAALDRFLTPAEKTMMLKNLGGAKYKQVLEKQKALGLSEELTAEETLAVMRESSGANPSAYQRAIATVRGKIRQVFPKMKMNDAEIEVLFRDAQEVVTGEGGGFVRNEPIAQEPAIAQELVAQTPVTPAENVVDLPIAALQTSATPSTNVGTDGKPITGTIPVANTAGTVAGAETLPPVSEPVVAPKPAEADLKAELAKTKNVRKRGALVKQIAEAKKETPAPAKEAKPAELKQGSSVKMLTPKSDGGSREVKGRVLYTESLPDVPFVVYKAGDRYWRVAEYTTGMSLGSTYGKTEAESLGKFNKTIEVAGVPMVREVIATAKVLNSLAAPAPTTDRKGRDEKRVAQLKEVAAQVREATKAEPMMGKKGEKQPPSPAPAPVAPQPAKEGKGQVGKKPTVKSVKPGIVPAPKEPVVVPKPADVAPFPVEGVKFNGVQRAEGMEDQQVWTDAETGGTFYMPANATVEDVTAYRDGVRKKFADAQVKAPAPAPVASPAEETAEQFSARIDAQNAKLKKQQTPEPKATVAPETEPMMEKKVEPMMPKKGEKQTDIIKRFPIEKHRSVIANDVRKEFTDRVSGPLTYAQKATLQEEFAKRYTEREAEIRKAENADRDRISKENTEAFVRDPAKAVAELTNNSLEIGEMMLARGIGSVKHKRAGKGFLVGRGTIGEGTVTPYDVTVTIGKASKTYQLASRNDRRWLDELDAGALTAFARELANPDTTPTPPSSKKTISPTAPATRDDQGNVIPLSKRFNEESDNIRFRTAGNDNPIIASAYKHPNGKIYTGASHMEADMQAEKDDVEVLENMAGFVTKDGDFLTRKEAYEHAKVTKQLAVNPEEMLFPEQLEATDYIDPVQDAEKYRQGKLTEAQDHFDQVKSLFDGVDEKFRAGKVNKEEFLRAKGAMDEAQAELLDATKAYSEETGGDDTVRFRRADGSLSPVEEFQQEAKKYTKGKYVQVPTSPELDIAEKQFFDNLVYAEGRTPQDLTTMREQAENEYLNDPKNFIDYAIAGKYGNTPADEAKLRLAQEKLWETRVGKDATADDVMKALKVSHDYNVKGSEASALLNLRKNKFLTPESRKALLNQSIFEAPGDIQELIEKAAAQQLTPAENEKLTKWANKRLAVRKQLLGKKVKDPATGKMVNVDIDSFTDEQLMDDKFIRTIFQEISITKATTEDKFFEVWLNSILSGPVTLTVVNPGGNLASFALNLGLGRLVERGLGVATGAKLAPTKRSTRAMYASIFSKETLANAKKVFWEVYNTEQEVMGPKSRKLDVRGGALGGRFGKKWRTPMRILSATDQWFRAMFTPAITADYATRNFDILAEKGAFDKMLKEGKNLDRIYSAYMKSATDIGSKAYQLAEEEVTEALFQKPLKGTGLPKAIINTRNSEFMTVRLLSKYLFPFITTPTNIFFTGMRKSPAGLIPLVGKLAKGEFSGDETAKAEGVRLASEQVIALSALYAVFSILEDDDDDPDKLPRMTGNTQQVYGQSNAGQREFEKTNLPAMSIRIGDIWYSYSRIEPIATILATLVDSANMLLDIKHGRAKEVHNKAWRTVVGALTNRTYLKTVNDVIDVAQDGDMKKLDRILTEILSGFVPNIARSAMRATDPFIRSMGETKEGEPWVEKVAKETLRSTVPVSAFANEPQYDIAGKPKMKVVRFGEEIDPVLRFVSPFRSQSATNATKVDMMLYRYIKQNNPEKPWMPSRPEMPQIKQFGSKKAIKLTDAEYGKFQQIAGEFADERLRNMKFNFNNPTERDVDVVKKIYEIAHSVAKARITRDVLSRARAETTK